jgi:hypothetical protein
LNIGRYYRPEDADFSFWAFVFKPICPEPVRRPTSNAMIPHEWMVSEQHGWDPLFGLPVLVDPGTLSPDRLLTYFIPITL